MTVLAGTETGTQSGAGGDAGAGGVHRPAYLVFCDVDETLISCKSMFEFARFQRVRRYGDAGARWYEELAGEMRRQSAAGAPREAVNRSYYRAYTGESAATMTTLGRAWFDLASQDPGFFITSTVA
jgi:hypothetical protein